MSRLGMLPFTGVSATRVKERHVETWRGVEDDTIDGWEFVQVNPYEDTGGLAEGPAFARQFYKNPSHFGLFDGSVPRYSYNLKYDGSSFDFVFGIERKSANTDLADVKEWVVGSRYPNSTLTDLHPSPDTLETIPEIEPGDWVAGGRVHGSKNCIRPIRSTNSPNDPLDEDPRNAFVPAMKGKNCRTMLQVLFRPVRKSWYKMGIKNNGRKMVEDVTNYKVKKFPPRKVKVNSPNPARKHIDEQEGRPCFRVDINLLAISPNKKAAVHRAEEMGEMFSDLDNPGSKQELYLVPFNERLMRKFVSEVVRRKMQPAIIPKWPIRGPEKILTDNELGMLISLPSRDGKYEANYSDLDYSTMAEGPGVPSTADQPDIEL